MREGLSFQFVGHAFIARPALTLWWPEEETLIVADLHLGKSLRLARRGGALLPPWDTHDTLMRLQAEIHALHPRRLILLGDSFDDTAVLAELSEPDRSLLRAILDACDCVRIEGNHDPASGGVAQLQMAGLTLRHEAEDGPDISGHFHPSVKLGGRRWRCFVYNDRHLILPSFGSYTGGLDIHSPDFATVMPTGRLIAGTADRMFTAPFGLPSQP